MGNELVDPLSSTLFPNEEPTRKVLFALQIAYSLTQIVVAF